MFRHFRTWLTLLVRDIVRQELERRVTPIKYAIPNPGWLVTLAQIWEVGHSIERINLDINKLNRRLARIEVAMGKAGIAPALGDAPEEY